MNATISISPSLLLLLLLAFFSPAMAQQWEVQPLLPAPDNGVLDVAKIHDRLIFAGKFTELARWNGGTALFDLHTAQPNPRFFFPRNVEAAIPYNGGWLVYIQDSALLGRNYGTLQWLGADGNVKQKIPLKFKDSGHGASGINTMAADGDTLYVAGGFFSMNDLEREYAAALRISTGEILQWKPRVNNSIHSIVVSNTAVFMSGLFDTVSGSYQKRIARVSKGQGELQPWPKPIPDRLTNHFSFYINKKLQYDEMEEPLFQK